ncbi:MAG TPA: hypothetical protein VGF38_15755 [Ktedonobacterales bacterium]
MAGNQSVIINTLFKGETLRSMLNQAWTFSVIAQLALIAGIAFAIAAVIVLGTLIFEVAEMVTGRASVEAVEAVEATPAAAPEVVAVR